MERDAAFEKWVDDNGPFVGRNFERVNIEGEWYYRSDRMQHLFKCWTAGKAAESEQRALGAEGKL